MHSRCSGTDRPDHSGSPIPRMVRPRSIPRSRNSCQAGMIRAGFRPTSAISTKVTRLAARPSAARRSAVRGRVTATRTSSSAARPARMKSLVAVRKPTSPWYRKASCRMPSTPGGLRAEPRMGPRALSRLTPPPCVANRRRTAPVRAHRIRPGRTWNAENNSVPHSRPHPPCARAHHRSCRTNGICRATQSNGTDHTGSHRTSHHQADDLGRRRISPDDRPSGKRQVIARSLAVSADWPDGPAP